MQYTEALSRISEIHDHMAKGEVYRGIRSGPVALSGACGLLGASLQESLIPAAGPRTCVAYWVVVAVLGVVVGTSESVYNYVFHDDHFARRRSVRVLGQFVPCLAAGAAVTYALARTNSGLIPLLPGLWAVVFSLGIFSARPYLPRAIGWVALFYLAAGFRLLVLMHEPSALWGWDIAWTFGTGQLAAALVLYWNLERKDNG